MPQTMPAVNARHILYRGFEVIIACLSRRSNKGSHAATFKNTQCPTARATSAALNVNAKDATKDAPKLNP
jgi:hypothetical protein